MNKRQTSALLALYDGNAAVTSRLLHLLLFPCYDVIISGLIPGPPSYLKTHKDVFFSAVGTGFFDQCCPSGSLHLGFSSTAMHWLSER